MDAKDILGLPKNSLPIPQEKKSTPPKDSQRKPDAISLKVYALTGGVAPLMPSINQLKRRNQPENGKVTWECLSFTNSARKDTLQLYHWVKAVNGTPLTGYYSFAKYNKSVDVIKYTEEEYEKHLTDPAWTKEETDHLFELDERFDLRFVVIADRFPSSRSVEELKNRYYSVSQVVLIARAPSADVSSHPLEPYNITQEIERKRALSMVLSQTKHQERKDAEVLSEAKKITGSRMAAKAAHDAELAVTSNTSPQRIEKTTGHVETASPSNMQLTSGAAPLLSMADDAAVAAASLSRASGVLENVCAGSNGASWQLISRIAEE